MKKYLISENGKFYKTNLHCHSTISDGKLTPEQVKEEYLRLGYSAVAFTDHDVLIRHNDLTDENFVALNGYEIEIDLPAKIPAPYPFHREKCCHMCLVALSPSTTRQVCFHREKYLHRSAPDIINYLDYDKNLPNYERVYNHDCINEIMKTGRENGFFVTYNHPTWSGENYLDYMGYKNMHAMEIYNNECVKIGVEEYNSRVYDDMLRGGKRLYCIATDDMHRQSSIGGGYIMIKADKLDYESLTSSMLKGDFYASTGAEIKELYVEDDYLYITTAPAKMIALSMEIMRVERITAEENGFITSAKFKLLENYGYVRLTVTDLDGKKAYTNAYDVKDLLK